MELSRLKALNPKEVWPHEAHDFTPWLLENADALADVLGIDLELSTAEHPVGGFSLDLIGRDLTNSCVLIVENQLTSTDHGHLGQLLTYAAGTDAATIVWAATEFREEHRQAIDWLNELGGEKARFFGVEIGVVRIDDSYPAPLFKLRAQPNDWHAHESAMAKVSSETGGKGQLYRAFWARFLERLHKEHPTWSRMKTPPIANWIAMPAGLRGTSYGASFAMGGRIRTELYIDTGSGEENLAILEKLRSQKATIESAYSAELSWEDLPGKRGCRIADYGEGDAVNTDKYDEYIDWFFDTGTRLRNALGPQLAELQTKTP